MQALVKLIDTTTALIARVVAWAIPLMITATFGMVILRYAFSLGWAWLEDLVLYCNGFVLTLCAANTLRIDKHVRVDMLYQRLSPRGKAIADGLGILLLLFPCCGLILWQSLPYVAASWRIYEGALTSGGLPLLYLFKSSVVAFAGLMALQGLSLLLKQFAMLKSHHAEKGEHHA